MSRQNLSGKKYGRWTVLKFVERRAGNDYWLCRCQCGGEAEVAVGNLRSGRSRGCRACGLRRQRGYQGDDPLLYRYWMQRKRRKPWYAAWDEFARFEADCAPRAGRLLLPADERKPLGPKNFFWADTAAQPLSTRDEEYLRSARTRAQRDKRILKARGKGATCQQIADALALTAERVRQIIKEQG